MLTPNGTMVDFNVTADLHKITVHVLLTEGSYDLIRPVVVDTMEQNLVVTERLTLQQLGHLLHAG